MRRPVRPPGDDDGEEAKPAKAKPETAEQRAIRELQEKMAAQQAEIDQLKQQNAAKDAALSAAQSTAATAQSTAATAQSQAAAATAQAQSAAAAAQSQADAVTSLKSTVTDLQGANAEPGGDDQHDQDRSERQDQLAGGAPLQGSDDYAGWLLARLKVCGASVR